MTALSAAAACLLDVSGCSLVKFVEVCEAFIVQVAYCFELPEETLGVILDEDVAKSASI